MDSFLYQMQECLAGLNLIDAFKHIMKFAAKTDIQANCANEVRAFVIRRALLCDVTVHRRLTSELSMPVAVICE